MQLPGCGILRYNTVHRNILASVGEEETGASVWLTLNVYPPGGVLRVAVYNTSADDLYVLRILCAEESLAHGGSIAFPSAKVMLLPRNKVYCSAGNYRVTINIGGAKNSCTLGKVDSGMTLKSQGSYQIGARGEI